VSVNVMPATVSLDPARMARPVLAIALASVHEVAPPHANGAIATASSVGGGLCSSDADAGAVVAEPVGADAGGVCAIAANAAKLRHAPSASPYALIRPARQTKH
jgi:hypothetical protein